MVLGVCDSANPACKSPLGCAAPAQAIGEAVNNASVVYLTAPGHAVIFGRAEYGVFGAGKEGGCVYEIDGQASRQASVLGGCASALVWERAYVHKYSVTRGVNEERSVGSVGVRGRSTLPARPQELR